MTSPEPGDIISHAEMCAFEGLSLQRGMNFRPGGRTSVILMSVRRGAPYADRFEDDGRVLVYEGHDVNDTKEGPNPKTVDQPQFNPGGSLTQNGKFAQAALAFSQGDSEAEPVRVYEKIKSGIWTFNGVFRLCDVWREEADGRQVFKFRLELDPEAELSDSPASKDLDQTRVISSEVKREVWKRDDGRCVQCGSTDNLHFDHILPFSKGGTSLLPENVQLLCARHNLGKSDRIE